MSNEQNKHNDPLDKENSPKKQILIIDDDEIIQRQFKRLLNDVDVTLTSALNGLEGLDFLNHSQPDLIILDQRMPLMSGDIFLKKIRANPKFTNIPIIYMSSLIPAHLVENVQNHNVSITDKDILLDKEKLQLLVEETLAHRSAEGTFQTFGKKIVQCRLELLIRFGNLYPNPFNIVDLRTPAHPLIFANSHFYGITGYKKEEVLGENCRFLQGEFTNQSSKTYIRKALKEQHHICIDLKNVKKDASQFYNRLLLIPFLCEEGLFAVGLQSNIKAEQFLSTPAASTLVQEIVLNFDDAIFRVYQNQSKSFKQQEHNNDPHLQIKFDQIIDQISKLII